MHVYCIKNKANGKVYIGQSIRKEGCREKEHFYYALKGSRKCPHLYEAIRAHGREGFEIEKLATATTIDELNRLETLYIEAFKACSREHGYNLGLGGDNKRHCVETIEKMRAYYQSHSHPNLGRSVTQAHRDAVSRAQKGRSHSDSHRAARSAALKGRPWSERRGSHPWKGRRHTEESRLKMSRSHTGRKATEEERRKNSVRNRGAGNPNFGKTGEQASFGGKTHTAESKELIAAANRGKVLSAETRKKISDARRARVAQTAERIEAA